MWKFTQDRWVVRKEVAAVTKVSGFLFFLNPEVLSWPNAAGHWMQRVDAAASLCSHSACFALHLEQVEIILSLEKNILSSSHEFPLLQDWPCSWATGMHRVRSCVQWKVGHSLNWADWRRLHSPEQLLCFGCRKGSSSVGICQLQYWIKTLKWLRHLNILLKVANEWETFSQKDKTQVL